VSGRNQWHWTAILNAIAAAPAAAQQGAITSGGQPGGLPLGSGSSTLSSTGTPGGTMTGGFGNNSLGSGNNSSGSNNGLGNQVQTFGDNGISIPTGQQKSSLDASNFLSGYFANPSYQGLGTGNGTPGGFGSPLYTLSASGAGNTRGGRGTTGTNTFGANNLGANRGIGGQNANNQSGIVIPLPVQINYTAQVQFKAPPVAPSKIQLDIRSVLDNNSLIANGKSVQIITDVNNNVTLRGNVTDENEARLIEGIVRLTPGVAAIKNELGFPLASK
jgi:hypothetical protein